VLPGVMDNCVVDTRPVSGEPSLRSAQKCSRQDLRPPLSGMYGRPAGAGLRRCCRSPRRGSYVIDTRPESGEPSLRSAQKCSQQDLRPPLSEMYGRPAGASLRHRCRSPRSLFPFSPATDRYLLPPTYKYKVPSDLPVHGRADGQCLYLQQPPSHNPLPRKAGSMH